MIYTMLQVDAELSQLSKYMKLLEAQNKEMLESDGKEPDWDKLEPEKGETKKKLEDFAFHPDKSDRKDNAPFSLGKYSLGSICVFEKKWLTPWQRRWREYEAVKSMGFVDSCHSEIDRKFPDTRIRCFLCWCME